MACHPGAPLPFALGAGASFASTLGSTWLIRQVERDRSLLPYAVYRLGLAAVILGRLGARRRLAAPPAPAPGVGGVRSIYDNGDVTDAYAAAGVDTRAGRPRRRRARRRAAARSTPGASRLSVPLAGHYASVIRIAPDLGVALATDSVGSKVIVAEQAQRFGTIGIDCVAMNVNDLICVGAEPLALLDYLAVESRRPDPARGARRAGCGRARRTPGVEIPGGEVCQLPEVIRGHPSPYGFDLVGSAFGTVALDAIVDGSACAPGDALVGLPASGVHSNGLTLARRALLEDGGLSLDARPAELGGATVADALLEPTVIYVRAVLALLRSGIPVHGLAHITGGGLLNLLRLGDGAGFEITDAAARCPRSSRSSRELGNIPAAEMWEVFNMGCGFCAVVADADAERAVALLGARHPGTAVIGRVTDAAGPGERPRAGHRGRGRADQGGLASRARSRQGESHQSGRASSRPEGAGVAKYERTQ